MSDKANNVLESRIRLMGESGQIFCTANVPEYNGSDKLLNEYALPIMQTHLPYIGKFLISKQEPHTISIACYVPETAPFSAAEWVHYAMENNLFNNKNSRSCVVKSDEVDNPFKEQDLINSRAIAFIKQHRLYVEEDDEVMLTLNDI